MNFFKKTYQGLENRRRVALTLILVSFLTTFSLIRLVTNLQKAHLLLNQQGMTHIHHLVPGIILLIVCGYIDIAFWSNNKIRPYVAVFYGIGAALTIDEFALWLFLKDVYWEKQGRISVDAVIIAIVLLGLFLVISEVHDYTWIKKMFQR